LASVKGICKAWDLQGTDGVTACELLQKNIHATAEKIHSLHIIMNQLNNITDNNVEIERRAFL